MCQSCCVAGMFQWLRCDSTLALTRQNQISSGSFSLAQGRVMQSCDSVKGAMQERDCSAGQPQYQLEQRREKPMEEAASLWQNPALLAGSEAWGQARSSGILPASLHTQAPSDPQNGESCALGALRSATTPIYILYYATATVCEDTTPGTI